MGSDSSRSRLKGLVFRWREALNQPFQEVRLALDYSLAEVQYTVNYAIENKGVIGLVMVSGESLHLDPDDLIALLVAEPGEL